MPKAEELTGLSDLEETQETTVRLGRSDDWRRHGDVKAFKRETECGGADDAV